MPTYSYTVSGAQFGDGTTVSGSWTATYDANGKLTSVTNVSLTVTGPSGTTDFTGTGSPTYSGHSTPAYEFEIQGDNKNYVNLYIDWQTFTPASLFTAPAPDGQYTSVVGSNGGLMRLPAGGTGIVNENSCFAAGTRILTASGEVAVESLQPGDEIVLHDGSLAPVIWLGKRRVNLRMHPQPEKAQPVQISAGALADGVPARDLLLSPDHALLLEDVLVPAKALLNGFNIVQLDIDSVMYFHVELACHAVLYAEGTPAESYLETGNRAAFTNGAASIIAHPDFAQTMREQNGCAPFAESGPVVEAIRTQILRRANLRLSDDTGLNIIYQNGYAVITSHSAVPGEIFVNPQDRRLLGVKIASLHIGGKDVPLDHPELNNGWHDLEQDGRWTNGSAVIPAALLQGARDVAVTLAAAMPHVISRQAA